MGLELSKTLEVGPSIRDIGVLPSSEVSDITEASEGGAVCHRLEGRSEIFPSLPIVKITKWLSSLGKGEGVWSYSEVLESEDHEEGPFLKNSSSSPKALSSS